MREKEKESGRLTIQIKRERNLNEVATRFKLNLNNFFYWQNFLTNPMKPSSENNVLDIHVDHRETLSNQIGLLLLALNGTF